MVQWCHLGILLPPGASGLWKRKSPQDTLFSYLSIWLRLNKQCIHDPIAELHIWRVPESCGLKLIPPELLEDLVINPCPVSTSPSSFITIPVHCGSSCLGRVFFSSGRNTLHFVRWSALHIWSTSLRCARTNLHCPMSATQCNTFMWHTVSRQQVIFGEVGVMFGTRALCGHLGIWAVSSIQQYSVLSSIPKCSYSKVIVPLEIICTC